MKLILDIETKPDKELTDIFANGITVPKNYKDPKKINNYLKWKRSEAESKMSTDTDFAKIFCIGVKELGEEPKIVTLTQLGELIDKCSQLITYNGKKFDLPLILKSGIKQNTPLPYTKIVEMKKRYTDLHIDLMELINEYGSWKSLDQLLQVYCGVAKTPIDFDVCTDKELEDHCLEDLVNTEKLYNKFKPLIV